MLTLSKVVVEVGNRADAARAGDYRLELEAAPEAFARSDYQLAEQRAVAEIPDLDIPEHIDFRVGPAKMEH